MIAVGAGKGASFARLPEASDLKIAGQVFGVETVRIAEKRGEDLGCTVKFPVAWGGVNEVEGGQPAEDSLVPIQVAGEPRDAMMGWIAVDKSGQGRYWSASISGGDEDGKPVLEIAVQSRV